VECGIILNLEGGMRNYFEFGSWKAEERMMKSAGFKEQGGKDQADDDRGDTIINGIRSDLTQKDPRRGNYEAQHGRGIFKEHDEHGGILTALYGL